MFILFIFVFIIILCVFSGKNTDIGQIERGFQNLDKTSLKSFSINFFFILIIFIIFDLELILGLPIILQKFFFFNFLSSIFILTTLISD